MDTIIKILETVLYPMIAYVDMVIEKDLNPILATAGLMGIATGYIGAIASPFLIKAHFNQTAQDNTCKYLDKTPTSVFNVAADENSYDSFQKQAIESADNLRKKMGNGYSYSSEEDCALNHKHYSRHQYIVMEGSAFASIPRQRVEFNPHIVGYQVANDNPKMAVPLYSSIKIGHGMRPDGALIAMPEL